MKSFAFTGRLLSSLAHLSLFVFPALTLIAADSNPPPPVGVADLYQGKPRISFPYPGGDLYQFFSATNPAGPYLPDASGLQMGLTLIVTNTSVPRFYQATVTPMSSNDVFAANVLNRLTYGPTPDDIEHIRAVGPVQFIAEQMAAENITDTLNEEPVIINTPIPIPPPPPLTNWIRVSATGTATSTNYFIYLSAAGRVYLDDLRLVVGTNADTGPNLLLNGDFEDLTLTNGWTVASIYSTSVITNSPTVDGLAASGTNCLLLNGTAAGSGGGSSLQQVYSVTNYPTNTRFTLSFSYLPVRQTVTNVLTLTARLSGSVTSNSVSLPPGPIPPPTPPVPPPAINVAYQKLTNTTAFLDELRAWHVHRAVHGPRQLHEVLVQFFQNHLTTQYQKTKEWFDNNYSNAFPNETNRQWLAVELHWREHKKIRDALLNPNCNFYDLLKISIESPAMVIYLDTVLNSRAAPNQNYGRELLELHAMGADNGYVQQDIVEMAKVWTGWRVVKKAPADFNNPFAPAVTDPTNAPGFFTLHYVPGSHESNAVKRLFTNVVVHPRFGSQFRGGLPYPLTITNGGAATFTNGFAEGYKVINHLANLPYTMEFLSVKLCRLFVHENFEFGVYDYTTNNPTLEVELVRDCMTVWDTPGPDGRRGNIRSVLDVIFNSALFRSQGASQQKIKTPLEFTASAIRAIRVTSSDTNNWISSTSDTDGYGVSGTNGNTTALNRMGNMGLFNKTEPDGFSEFGRIWLNTANLCERMRFAQHLLMPTSSSLKSSDYGSAGLRNTSDPVKLLKLKTPAGSWNDAGAVVDFFLGLLYPGEGRGNLGPDRQAAMDFLNVTELGAASPFSALPNTGAAYDGRVRGMVALLMCFPRFQEQ